MQYLNNHVDERMWQLFSSPPETFPHLKHNQLFSKEECEMLTKDALRIALIDYSLVPLPGYKVDGWRFVADG